ncbi:MAG TPA: LamG domain-containing protein [Phycisphaerales bacterium]|nr:LamG domain-containing protein [Phycisphaerales bacterium]
MGPWTNGLVGSYPMHGDASEISGRGMAGLLTGNPTSATNRFGMPMGAMAFHGGMDGIVLTNVAVDLATNHQNTVCFWLNRAGERGGSTVSMPFGWGNTNQPLCLLFDSSGSGQFGFRAGMGGMYAMVSAMMATDTWMHVAAVFNNGPISGSQLYVDGQPMGGMMSMSGMMEGMLDSGSAGSTAFVGAGGTPNSGTNPFSGMMGDLRIYDRALTPDEIMGIYRMETGARMRLTPGAKPGAVRIEIDSMMMGWMFQLQSSIDLVRWVDQGGMIMPDAQGMNTVAPEVTGPMMYWRSVGRP